MDYKTALEFCGGSQSEMARRLGVSQGAVSRWSRMPRIPPGQQFRIAALTGGVLKVDPECLPASLQQPPAPSLPALATGAVSD